MKLPWVCAGLLLLSSSSVLRAEQFQLSFSAGGGAALQRSLVRGLDKTVNGKPLLYLVADAQYRGFFLENSDKRRGYGFGQSTVGYRLWQDEDSSLALIGSNVNGMIAAEMATMWGTIKVPELSGIKQRGADFMLGLRWQQQRGEHYWSFDFGRDIDYHHGDQARFFYSYRQILRNWDLYYNLGLQLADRQVLNYYFGVSGDEVSSSRPLYQPGAGMQLQVGLAAVYPLSQQWLFESGVAVLLFSDAYSQSPLVQGQTDQTAYLGVRYVF